MEWVWLIWFSESGLDYDLADLIRAGQERNLANTRVDLSQARTSVARRIKFDLDSGALTTPPGLCCSTSTQVHRLPRLGSGALPELRCTAWTSVHRLFWSG